MAIMAILQLTMDVVSAKLVWPIEPQWEHWWEIQQVEIQQFYLLKSNHTRFWSWQTPLHWYHRWVFHCLSVINGSCSPCVLDLQPLGALTHEIQSPQRRKKQTFVHVSNNVYVRFKWYIDWKANPGCLTVLNVKERLGYPFVVCVEY